LLGAARLGKLMALGTRLKGRSIYKSARDSISLSAITLDPCFPGV
jgi:hypothetical protein